MHLGARRQRVGRGAPQRGRDDLDAVAEIRGALAQRKGNAFDDHIGSIVVPVVARYAADTAADALGEPIVFAGSEEMAVTIEHILADRCHLSRGYARVNLEVFQRSVKACDMLLQAKSLPVETASHVENCITAQKALIPKRDHDLALTDDLAVEPSDAFVDERHRKPSHCYLYAFYGVGASAERSGVWIFTSGARTRSSPAPHAASAARLPSCWRPRDAMWRSVPAKNRLSTILSRHLAPSG